MTFAARRRMGRPWAQLRGYRETTGDGKGAKATRQELLDDVRSSRGVVGRQECREHDQ
jgi:hypothetical protein